MPTIKDLHELHLRRLDVTLAESDLLLQREGGLDGELKTSGSICERFVRDTLQRFIVPGQFRITSGFVATPTLLREQRNLPQCDLLIVDRDTPPLLRFDDSGIEVVPRESVCGIVEIKRTLTKKSLKEGLGQIQEIIEALEEEANFKSDTNLNRFNRHIGFHNHSSDKPLLGLIALQSQLISFGQDAIDAVTNTDSLIDFLWTADGNFLVPAFGSPEQPIYYSHTARPATKTWLKLDTHEFQAAESPFYKLFSGPPMWSFLIRTDQGLGRASVFGKVIGVVSLMLSRVTSRPMQENQINGYYLREP